MQKRGFLFLLITLLFFSSYEVVGKLLISLVNPYQLNFLRFFFGSLILMPFAIKSLKVKGIALRFKDLAFLFLIGTINVVISMSCLQLGLNLTRKAGLAAVIFSSNPLFVSISAHFLLGERLTIKKVLGTGVGIVGTVIAFYNNLFMNHKYALGVLLLLFSAITYGIYTAMGKKFTQKSDSIVMNAFSFLFGSIVLLTFILFKHFPVFMVPPKAVIPMLYLTICVTGIAYYTYFLGLMYTSASLGSMIFFLKPILANVFATVFFNEQLSANLVLGTLIVLLGIIIVQCSETKPFIK